jgi:NTP pyrophosphatase (non-canonical NTP hydrolase)
MELEEYQRRAAEFDERRHVLVSVAGLVGEIGSVTSVFKKMLRLGKSFPGMDQQLEVELGDTLWYLSNVASLSGLSLENIAKSNLEKAGALFSPGTNEFLDEEAPSHEHLPRHAEFEFVPDAAGCMLLRYRGQTIGNPLTDNAEVDDYYRFHDVFHLAYAAVLGWSPVLRHHLGAKRRYDPIIDEVQDGGRARITEELVSQVVFRLGEEKDYFSNEDNIDLGLLQMVMKLTERLEVRKRTAKQWRRAISVGFETFRELKEFNGGWVTMDMTNRMLSYRKPGLL